MAALRSRLLPSLLLASACVGDIGDAPPEGDVAVNGVHGRSGQASVICQEDGVQAARSPFRRLRTQEYNNAVRDLLGDTSAPADRFPTTSSESVGFEVAVSPFQFELYADVASSLAESADLPSLVDCTDLDGSACADRFIREMGMRVYRRPLDGDAASRLRSVYEASREGGHEHALRRVLATMLQSPNFLYLAETSGEGSEGSVVPLDGFERASRLSFLLWQSTPDDALLEAARDGALMTPEGVGQEVARMMQDPRAVETILAFHREWLHLNLEGVVIEGVDGDTLLAMEEETERFVRHVLYEGEGTLEELFTASYSFLNARLTSIYGVDRSLGDAFERVELDPRQRAGLLTHASFLAHTASEGSAAPVFRGKFVSEQFLCRLLPEAPDDIPPFSASGEAADTLRERLEEHRANPRCAGCHRMMDPIGFAFEDYDAAGRWRDGTSVDAAGELDGTIDADGNFVGAVELAERLSQSADLRQCMNTQWFRFGLRRLEGEADLCSLRSMDEAFEANDHDLLSIVVSLTRTDAFLNRRLGVRGDITSEEDGE